MTNLQFLTLVLTKKFTDKFMSEHTRYNFPRGYVFEVNHAIRNHIYTYLMFIDNTNRRINIPVLLNLLNMKIFRNLNTSEDDRSSLFYMAQTELYEGLSRMHNVYNPRSQTTSYTVFRNDLNYFRGVKLPEIIDIIDTLNELHR